MRFSLFPKENVFFSLLNELILNGEKTVRLFQHVLEEWPSSQILQEIKQVEHDCDQIVHKIMVKLNKTFVTPIDREDIQMLTKSLDDIIDIVQALSARMSLFQVKTVTDDLKKMTGVLKQAVSTLILAVPQIEHLKKPNQVLDLCIEIHRLENQGDRLFEKALGDLFKNETDAIEILKWKEIYDFLERAIDTCEDVADILWSIVVKYG